MIVRIIYTSAILISCILAEDFNAPEPKYSWDEDGVIPVVEGFGGNVDIVEEDDVLILTRDNFQYVVSTRDMILVEFYAQWCGHCKALAPEYASAALELKASGIPLAKVDATSEPELAKEHLIEGFPTLKLFRKNGEVEDYEGGRTAGDIVDYMKQHADPNYKPPPTSVLVLTNANFTKTVKSSSLILVEFFAPWCKHCKRLEPEFEGAARELKSQGIVLATVDGIAEKELTDTHSVSGYPALMIFRNGRQFDYKGPREKGGIVNYMKEQAKLPSWEIQTITEANNNIARTEATVFAYFTERNYMYEEYIAAANELRGKLGLLHTFKSDVGKKFGLNDNTITILMPQIFYSKYEASNHVYEKTTATFKEIGQWIVIHSVPLVGHRTKGNTEFKYAQRPLVVIYYDVNFSHQYVKDTQYIRKKILSVADKYRDFTFAICKEDEFEDEIKSLGLDDSGEDVNVGIFNENLKYPMKPDDDFSADVLDEFVNNFKLGKVKPYLKSQPIPKRQDSPVKVLVARNFDKEVMQSKKDVMIEFYAPWCGHCKSLDPIYRKLAKQMTKSDPDVMIAKMDATANDVPPMFKVNGFPTIYFLRSNEKDDPIIYEGDRTLIKLKEFIAQESSIFETQKDEL